MLLELVCFILIVRYNQNQRTIFLHSANLFAGALLDRYDAATGYFNLREVNDSLALANARYLERISPEGQKAESQTVADSLESLFDVIPARVINNSISQNHNYLTLNKGSRDGIRPHSGVITDKGLVGIVRDVSPGFARVMSLLHRQTRISAAIQRSGYFGSLVWRRNDPSFMSLEDVPKHADIKLGDTVVTSGYSAIFPEGILIGVIDDYELESGSNAYKILVHLNEDLSRLDYVYVTRYRAQEELLELEERVENE